MSEQRDEPRRRRRQPPAAPPPQGSVAKGAILVVMAVVIGFALLQDSDQGSTDLAVGAADNPVATDDGDDEDPAATSSTTTTPPRPPSQVKVLVANGSDVNGAAGAQTDALATLGYVTADPTNTEQKVTDTVVYYTVGFEAEAEVLAEAIGVDPATAVQPLPTPAPVPDLQLSQIVVVVGPDIATTG